MFKLLRYLKPDAKNIIAVVMLALVESAASLALPYLMSFIVKNGINALDMRVTLYAAGAMVVMAAIGLAAGIISYKISSGVLSRYSRTLREAVFKKVNTLNPDQLNHWGTGALVTRSTNDIGLLEECASFLMRGVISIPILVFGGGVLAFLADPWLALIMFTFVPVVVAVLYLVVRRIMPLWEKSDEYIDKQNSIIRERLTGIRVIRAFNREDKECERANEATRIMAENIIKANVNMGILTPLILLGLNMVTVLILLVGAELMQSGKSAVTGADIIAIVQYVGLVMNGIMMFAMMLAFLPKVVVNSRRINEVLETEVPAEPDDADTADFSGGLKFNHVNFAYEGAAENALSDICFEIQPGEKVAFIGGTGSGKSTIVRLIMKFFTSGEGEISFDGRSINDISGKKVRDNVTCVLQNATIFSGTIRSNVRMAAADADDAAVYDALTVAELKGFVDNLENGLDYEIQSGGTNLSGGQKQRIAIARALLKKGSIYLFDDSFSALDFLTESRIKEKLNKKLEGRTRIIMTQRASTAAACDRIFVLENGRIAGSGRHDDLLENCRQYREIYESQTGSRASEGGVG
ncbi:MAG: ABC transporter ATP-binding protein [Eubacteriales bacterium]|nr:ABC transporter ATP-binding protein [Christensenellaceae bacterium]MDY2751881.1 ABC transporter ATP-binding protein [Eubacteriales bacterium]